MSCQLHRVTQDKDTDENLNLMSRWWRGKLYSEGHTAITRTILDYDGQRCEPFECLIIGDGRGEKKKKKKHWAEMVALEVAFSPHARIWTYVGDFGSK